jgi:hypothetical protein
MATIDDWTFQLTGLPVDRIEQARATIDAFGIDHLSNELTHRADIDAASAACMLESAIDALKDRGVNENKLIGKLRRDPDVWPSVTELIAGRSVLRFFDPNSEIELDSRPAKAGPNADFRIREPGSKSGVSIEFKSIGLSDVETDFFLRTAPVLPRLCPDSGISTTHIAFENDHPVPVPSRAERRIFAREDRRRQKKLPPHIRELHGGIVAAHYTEQRYLERVRSVVESALRQLNTRDDCWVAIWWSNGAPALSVQQVLSTINLPSQVLGVMLVGAAVALPVPEIHYYDQRLPREELLNGPIELPVVSLEGNPLAEPIFDAFERSTGVRPSLLLDPHGIRGKRQQLLLRDGSRRIFPFNLLVDADPPEMRDFVARTASDRGETKHRTERRCPNPTES